MVYLLTRNPSNPLYNFHNTISHYPFKFITKFDSSFIPPRDSLLLITHDTYRNVSISVMKRFIKYNIPVLVIADGIIEYRNSWTQNHKVQSGVFNPIVGHKLACIGKSQIRHLELLKGNKNKCELVGLPRLDDFIIPTNPVVGKNILVCSSKTPWFSEEEREQVIYGFNSIKKISNKLSHKYGVSFTWRVTAEIADELDVESNFEKPLAKDLSLAKAVITTPSTLILESMYTQKPVAVIDFTNSPHYVQSAWNISSCNQIEPTVAEIIDPPSPKMVFQEASMRDSLQTIEKASFRMQRLVTSMIEIGKKCRAKGKELKFPPNILSIE